MTANLPRQTSMTLSPGRQSEWLRVVWLALLALVMAGYQWAGLFYGGFRVPQGNAMNHLPPEELAHYAIYAAFGAAAVALLYAALRGLPLCDRLGAGVSALCGRRGPAIAVAAVLVLVATVGLSSAVLGHAVTTDDEHAYRFIARTLRMGSVVAPSPGGDREFFGEQFVVLDDRVRFGKYPIGHPLLLAAGQALGLESLVVPALTALLVLPLYALGARLYGPRVAGLACLLYAASPQVWFTGATFLSQPASALMLVLGLALLVHDSEGSAPPLWRLALAGACFGYGVAVRPLPGVLFAAVAALDVLMRPAPAVSRRIVRVLVFGLAAALLAGLVPLVNHFQTGSAFVSGYQAFHTPGAGITAVMSGGPPLIAMSLAGTLIRENFWLFGWPLSFLGCFFAGRLPRAGLLWGVVGAEVAYRYLAPKVGVGGAGPLYVFEAVPLLCLVSAAGFARLARSEVGWLRRPAPLQAAPLLVALTAASFALFLPPKLADLRRMGLAQLAVERQASRIPGDAIVFHEAVVPPQTMLSWAYFPRFNGPRMDDRVLYARFQRSGGVARNVEFWRRRYPGRSAWYFGWDQRSGPFLADLEDFVRKEKALEPTMPSSASAPPPLLP